MDIDKQTFVQHLKSHN